MASIRAWHFKLKKVLISIGVRLCDADVALLYYLLDCCLSGIISVHVHDLMRAGTSKHEMVIRKANENFLVVTKDSGSFKTVCNMSPSAEAT